MAQDDGISWIIEAMRKIHQQKQRRTVDRIVNAVRQKSDISMREIAVLLEKAEQRGIIRKVIDNSVCFYKECNGVARKQRKRSIVQNVLSEMITATLKGSDAGYSMKTLLKSVRTQCSFHVPDDFNWKRQMCLAIKRLIKDGLVQRVGKVLWLTNDTDGRNSFRGISGANGFGDDGMNNNGLDISGMSEKHTPGSAGDTVNCLLARCASNECKEKDPFNAEDAGVQFDTDSAVREPGMHHHKSKKQLQNTFLMKKSRTLLSHCRFRHDLDLSHADNSCGRRRSLRLTSGSGSNCVDLNIHTEKEHTPSEMISMQDVCVNCQYEAVASYTGADEGASNVSSQDAADSHAVQFIANTSISLCDAYLGENSDSVVSCAELIDDIISCVAPQEALNAKSNTSENECVDGNSVRSSDIFMISQRDKNNSNNRNFSVMESSDSSLQLLTSGITPFSPACPVEAAVVADDAGHLTPSGPSPVSSPSDCYNESEAVDRSLKLHGRRQQVKSPVNDITLLNEPMVSGKRRRLTATRRMAATPPMPTARDLQLEVIRKQLTLVARRRTLATEKCSAACAMHADADIGSKFGATKKDSNVTTTIDDGVPLKSLAVQLKSSVSGLKDNSHPSAVRLRRRGRPPGSVSKHRKESLCTKAAYVGKQLGNGREQCSEEGNGMGTERLQEQPAKASQSSFTLQRVSSSSEVEQVHDPEIGVTDEEMFRATHPSDLLSWQNLVGTRVADCNSSIVIGEYKVFISSCDADAKRIYVCECCFEYFASHRCLQRHMIKRGSHHVPGSEIYRNNEVSVFELDGVASASSCLRLNDLAQTLSQRAMAWNDITKCLYYVMYKRNVEDQHSCHFVGFISKLKPPANHTEYVLVLPQYRQQHFGRFLADLCYQICRHSVSRVHLKVPEEHVKSADMLFLSLCKSVVLRSIVKFIHQAEICVEAISQDTGFTLDIVKATLAKLEVEVDQIGLLKLPSKEHLMKLATEDIQRHLAFDTSCIGWKLMACKRRRGRPRRPDIMHPTDSPSQGDIISVTDTSTTSSPASRRLFSTSQCKPDSAVQTSLCCKNSKWRSARNHLQSRMQEQAATKSVRDDTTGQKYSGCLNCCNESGIRDRSENCQQLPSCEVLPGVAINSCLNDNYAMASMSLTGERLVPLLKRKRGRPAKVKGKRGRPSKRLSVIQVSDFESDLTSSTSSVATSAVLRSQMRKSHLVNDNKDSPASSVTPSFAQASAVSAPAASACPQLIVDQSWRNSETVTCIASHSASVSSAAPSYSDQDDLCSAGITVGSSDQCDIFDTTFESVDSTLTNMSHVDRGLTPDVCVSVSMTGDICNSDISSIRRTLCNGDCACCCAVRERVCRTSSSSIDRQNVIFSRHRHPLNTVVSEYEHCAVPVMAAQLNNSLRCTALLSSATSSCNTLTVSSPSFSLPLCAPVATKPGGLSADSLIDVTGAGLSRWLPHDLDVLSDLISTASVSANNFMHRPANAALPDFVGHSIYGQPSGTNANTVRANALYRMSTSSGIIAGLPADIDCLTDSSRHASQSTRLLESCLADSSSLNRTDTGHDAVQSARNGLGFDGVSARAASDPVCSITPPVMANVLLQSGFSSPGNDHAPVSDTSVVRPPTVQPSCVPVTGLSLLRAVGLQDVSSIISALIGQQVSGQTASQPGETLLPVIAIFNVGNANLGLSASTNNNALPFINVPLSAGVVRYDSSTVNLQQPAGCI